MFTLSGGHIFPFYDAVAKGTFDDWRIIDVRHEQTATFAAEATAKLTRRPGVAVLTAGPDVTNGISAVTSAWFNGTPLVVLGGRAPQARWGAGSLQEFEQVPVLAPITKRAATATDVDGIAALVDELARDALTPHRGPVFCSFPLDVVFRHGSSEIPEPIVPRGVDADPDEVSRAVELIGN